MHSQNVSRAQTPMVGISSHCPPKVPHVAGLKSQWSILSLDTSSPRPSCIETIRLVGQSPTPKSETFLEKMFPKPSRLPFWNPPTPRIMRTQAKIRFGKYLQDPTYTPSVPKRKFPQRPSALAQFPDISDLAIPDESNLEYAIVVSMYEVYNDRIFDLLTLPTNSKDLRRRHLLFKSTEASPERKVVAGLRKVVCGNYEEALMVLETGLVERRVAGTGSNSVSSRSHGFFCVEVKKRPRSGLANAWSGAQLTIVDLAGE